MKTIYLLLAGLSGLSFAATIQSDPFIGTIIDASKWQLPPYTDGNGVVSQDDGLYYHNNGSGTDSDEVNLWATGVASVASDWTVRFEAHVPDLAAVTAPGQSVGLEMKVWNSADENDRADIQTSIVSAPAPYGKVRTLGADITNDYWQTDPVSGGSTGVLLDLSTQSQVTLAFSWSASTTTLSAWYAPAGGGTDWIRLTSWNLGTGSPTEWSLGAGASFKFYIGGSSSSLDLLPTDNVQITNFLVSDTALSGRIPPTITTGDNPSRPDFIPLPQGAVGNPYSRTIQANGGALPHVWSLVIGSLPPGLTLDSATGTIHGTPTLAGTADFRVRVTGSDGAYADGSYGITVLPDPFIDSYSPPMTSHNNIREFDGTLDVFTDYTLAVEQDDASHYTATFLINDGGSQTIANLLRTGNRLQSTVRPMPVTGSNLLDFIMLSDGVNRAYVHVAQETYDPDDVSFGVASWTTHVGDVTAADWAGTWDFDTYGDPDIRNDADGFDHDLFTLEIQQVDADHIQVMLPSGGALPLLVSGNTAYLESPPLVVGTIRYHEFRLQGDGQQLSVHSVASEIDNLTDVAVTIGLAEKTAMPPNAPTVTTGEASDVTATSVTLNGTVNPNGSTTAAQFEYGLTTAYGNTANVTLSPNDGSVVQDVSTSISGLQSGQTYHYRLTGTNGAGAGTGEDMMFTTYPEVPYTFAIADGEVTITGYTGTGGDISIPSTINGLPVTMIGNGAFEDCSELTSVIIPNSVFSIGWRAFSNCRDLTSVSIPDSITSLQYGVFYGCWSLNSVSIPSSVTSIGDDAFSICVGLSSITIPPSVTSIGDSAFSSCVELSNIIIPASVASIGDSAFSLCDSLTQISVDSLNPYYSSLDGVLFSKDGSLLIQCPGGKSGAYITPASVISIGDYAFYECNELTSVTITNSVASIGNGAFNSCDELTSVSIPNSVTSIGDGAFSACYILTSIAIPDSMTSIGNRLFSYCSGLINVSIPNSVTYIGENAFSYCESLTSVTIPNSVTWISEDAFSYCGGLTSVTIPSSVTTIEHDAFYRCSSLTSAKFMGDAPRMGDLVFWGTATGFKVYFFNGASGFTTPTWQGYEAVNMGDASPVSRWLVESGFPHDADIDQDRNGDGVSLLMAYALNLDPHSNLAGSLPAPVLGEDGTLSISYYAASDGITYIVETSNDLVSWHNSDIIISSPDANGHRTASIDSGGSSAYLRLKVTIADQP